MSLSGDSWLSLWVNHQLIIQRFVQKCRINLEQNNWESHWINHSACSFKMMIHSGALLTGWNSKTLFGSIFIGRAKTNNNKKNVYKMLKSYSVLTCCWLLNLFANITRIVITYVAWLCLKIFFLLLLDCIYLFIIFLLLFLFFKNPVPVIGGCGTNS